MSSGSSRYDKYEISERNERIDLLMMMLLHTFFMGLLILRIYRMPNWEPWVVPIGIISDILLWYAYQKDIFAKQDMLKFVIVFSYLCIFYYGIHPDVFIEMHMIFGMFIVATSLWDDFSIVLIGVAAYALTLFYHISITREAIWEWRREGSEVGVLAVTNLLVVPLFLRRWIDVRRSQSAIRNREIDRLIRELRDRDMMLSVIAEEGRRSAEYVSTSLSDILSRGGDTRMRRTIDLLRAESINGGERARDIVTLAELLLGNVRNESQSCSMAALSLGMISACERARGVRNVDVVYDFDRELPTSIVCDQDKLLNVVKILSDNAIYWSGSGAIRVAMTSRSTASGINIFISVDDTGPGIDDDVIENAYSDSISIVGEDGTARIGLVTAVRLARAMRAQLKFVSSPTTGTSASICLSCKVDDARPWISVPKRVPSVCVFYSPGTRDGDAGRYIWRMIERIEAELGTVIMLARTEKAAGEMAREYGADLVVIAGDDAKADQNIRLALGGDVEQMRLTGPITMQSMAELFERWSDGPSGRLDGDDQLAAIEALGADTKKGLEYCAGSAEMYLSLFRSFIERLPERCAELEELMDDGNDEVYRIRVHALRSNLRSLGFDALADTAHELEKAAASSATASVLPTHRALLSTVEDIAERAIH